MSRERSARRVAAVRAGAGSRSVVGSSKDEIVDSGNYSSTIVARGPVVKSWRG